MLAESYQKLLHAFFHQALNAHNLHLISTFVAPDFIFFPRVAGFPDTIEGFQQMMMVMFIQYPDLTYTPDSVEVRGSRVIVDWTARASHPGGVIGKKGVIIPIGRQLVWNGVTTVQIRDGKIEALWTEQDDASLREQLDLLPNIMCEN
jgi:predicted ester cyclase